ncbi:unnamed protein product [Acanthocheilonema viteae]|uniref:Uncharacterized protein n=1 Tax=Acanthocheilonema viteae TaxID=6277 RepID=A0A498SUH8_ACAVI|nr:unnamed protein product [Acanthocheilonema viteae]
MHLSLTEIQLFRNWVDRKVRYLMISVEHEQAGSRGAWLGTLVARIYLGTDTVFFVLLLHSSTNSTAASSPSSPQSDMQSTSISDLTVMDSSVSGLGSSLDSDKGSISMAGLDRSPIFALDQLKQAGVPFEKQLSPYLQMDPAVFRESTPQRVAYENLYSHKSNIYVAIILHIFMYIVPGESKGELEFAMGRIGWAVLSGYALGSLRGILQELWNPNTRQLPFKPFMTRLMNSSVKHGSGFAHPAGSIVFMFSVANMIFGKLRAKDDLNAVGKISTINLRSRLIEICDNRNCEVSTVYTVLAAGAVTGGLFRSARGLHASMTGAGMGAVVAFIWLLSDQDSRNRLWEMRKHLIGKQDYSY